ncbi:hypothetical protein L6452_20401 [Arctium lappa]|uniref:Uncharacterized protein n=1 Tax=Arctium lappa TaxID=4217 RepID=A0ACB9BCL4_ARCLA|nr:hypothetical protein L6452_20401 [Arctium lappa]
MIYVLSQSETSVIAASFNLISRPHLNCAHRLSTPPSIDSIIWYPIVDSIDFNRAGTVNFSLLLKTWKATVLLESSRKRQGEMGRAKKGPKFAVMKKLASHKAIKQHKEEVLNPNKKDLTKEKLPRNVPYVSSALFFTYNTALGPPYRVLVDTNFINFSIQNKLDLEKGMMDCLYAKCTPCITDCVMAELEKLGQKYRVALRIAKDPRFERLPCTHKGTYADDCIVERVTQHKCYMVATCDRDLKRRIRKIPGVPIMYITQHKYSIERLPEATMGGAPRI